MILGDLLRQHIIYYNNDFMCQVIYKKTQIRLNLKVLYEIRTDGRNEIIFTNHLSILLTLSQVHEAGHCVGISPGARLAAVASSSVQFR